MPSRLEDVPQHKHDAQARADLVGEYVLRLLGRPANLITVQARHLWGNNFRVNVFVGTDVTSGTIAHSYFLAMDSDGKFLGSQPAIHPHYLPAKDSSSDSGARPAPTAVLVNPLDAGAGKRG